MRIGLLHFARLETGADGGGDGPEAEALQAATHRLRGQAIAVSPGEARLPRCDAVIVSGPHAYAHASGRDQARAVAVTLAVESAAMRAVVAYAVAGGPVLGVGEGFRILCAAGLLPGTLGVAAPDEESAGAPPVDEADINSHSHSHLHLRVEGRPTPFTSAIPAGRVMRLGPASSAGRYHAADVDALEERGQIVFRYCDRGGGATLAANPRRSLRSIAGVCNPGGNVVALVAQPLVGDDGEQLIRSLHLHLGQAG